MKLTIRRLIDEHAKLPVPARTLKDGADLYAAGLTSFGAVQLLGAIESAFGVEFPARMLNRQSAASINAMAACLAELQIKANAA